MRKSSSFLVLALSVMVACTDNKSQKESRFDISMEIPTNSTVHKTKDSNGRIVEKWGNYKTDDQDENFRFFYGYDSSGKLHKERRFFLDDDNKGCLIKDSFNYEELKYSYDLRGDHYELRKRESTIPDFDGNGKYVGRKLYYIYDYLLDKYEYHDSK
jgi:hypothetical protein